MELSILAQFDELRRCVSVLTDGVAEEEFLKFVQNQEECRLQWLKAVQEAQRLQRELDTSLRSMSDLETKLFHARKLLEAESKARKEAEMERDTIEKKMIAVCDIVRNERDIKDETRDKLAFMNAYPKKRKSMHDRLEEMGNDINSTGSFLSDLSLTQSEDDFLDAKQTTKGWKKHRPSFPNNSSHFNGRKSRVSTDGKRRSINNNKIIEMGPNDKIIAHTKVSVPQDNGPIYAESIIQAVPQNNNNYTTTNAKENVSPNKFKTPTKSPNKIKTMFTPSAPSQDDIHANFVPNSAQKGVSRKHEFSTRTYLKSDMCTQCQKRIRFGKFGLKCRECRVCVHPDCKDKLTLACVPQSAGTPTVKGQMGFLSDYTPNVGPMIPGLIVHCINEIETRGLNEVGIYRVSGSERDVKALKERFLRGKGIPFLNNVDIHVLCGCVKDFLRSLKEPLIPTSLWRNFSNAVQSLSHQQQQKDLYDAISRLPQSNRDTLAYLVQHFQRIAECKDIKMPLSNLAKIFGPTIVGYSSADPDQHAIYAETIIQFQVMENLLNVPTDYWSQFVNVDSQKQCESEGVAALASKSYLSTPIFRSSRKERKFFATPPYPTLKK